MAQRCGSPRRGPRSDSVVGLHSLEGRRHLLREGVLGPVAWCSARDGLGEADPQRPGPHDGAASREACMAPEDPSRNTTGRCDATASCSAPRFMGRSLPSQLRVPSGLTRTHSPPRTRSAALRHAGPPLGLVVPVDVHVPAGPHVRPVEREARDRVVEEREEGARDGGREHRVVEVRLLVPEKDDPTARCDALGEAHRAACARRRGRGAAGGCSRAGARGP